MSLVACKTKQPQAAYKSIIRRLHSSNQDSTALKIMAKQLNF